MIASSAAAAMDIGSGAARKNAASMSALALLSNSPVVWRRCHAIGSSR